MTLESPLENQHVRNLDRPGDVYFHRTFVEQVKKARDSLFTDICEEIFVPQFSDIRSVSLLSKRSVTKEKLACWLETVYCIFDQYAIPWLEKAAPLTKELGKFKDEKISDQETIINDQPSEQGY